MTARASSAEEFRNARVLAFIDAIADAAKALLADDNGQFHFRRDRAFDDALNTLAGKAILLPLVEDGKCYLDDGCRQSRDHRPQVAQQSEQKRVLQARSDPAFVALMQSLQGIKRPRKSGTRAKR